MRTKRPLTRVIATLNEDVTVKSNSNGKPYVSAMATQKNGKDRRIMSYAHSGIDALKGKSKGDTVELIGHFGTEDQDGKVQSRGVFFPVGLSTPKEEAASEEAEA
jgi:hypothetical protein